MLLKNTHFVLKIYGKQSTKIWLPILSEVNLGIPVTVIGTVFALNQFVAASKNML